MSAPHLSNPKIPAPQGDEEPTELINMLTAKPYKAGDPYVARIRDGHALKVRQIDAVDDMTERMEQMRGFLNMGQDVYIANRFFCEYVSCPSLDLTQAEVVPQVGVEQWKLTRLY
jgi:maltose O-acetyltransferase